MLSSGHCRVSPSRLPWGSLAVLGIAVLFLLLGVGCGDKHTKDIDKSINMKMVLIPAGKFMMGSPKDEKDRCDDEILHEVTITKPFYLGTYLVTQEEYEKVMGRNPSCYSATGAGRGKVIGRDTSRFPMEEVSWFAAVEFCKRLSELPEEKNAGRTYRLPTEAEWEYACRAGTTTQFYFGDKITTAQANYDHRYDRPPTPVGSFPANAWGLYDMHGNVEEWCQDWYGPYPQEKVVDPQGPKTGERRVLRGGSFFDDASGVRSASRRNREPAWRCETIGFRVARDFKEEQ